MTELTATVAEARANFSKIANTVNATHKPVTVLKNSKPWVVITPADDSPNAAIPIIDWARLPVLKPDPKTGHVILPADADAADDDRLYDDLV